MRKLLLILALLVITCSAVHAQEADAPEGTLIKSAQVSGLPLDQLSPGLRQAIGALVGERLNRERVAELVARIEAERPEVVAAVRSTTGIDGEARVTFLVARISDEKDVVTNINDRYTVESVSIEGVPDSQISQTLRDDLQALVGSRLDRDEAKKLDDRLAAELPGYDVRRRISRGNETGHIRLIFEVSKAESARWLRFAPSTSKLLYHSDQGWSGLWDIPMGGRDNRVGVVLAAGNGDDLIEEYSGFGLRIESRKVATERLGLSLGFSRFHQTWQDATLTAVASRAQSAAPIPEPYRVRSTVEPSVTLAFSPHLRVAIGMSASELESLSRSPESQMASAAVASLSYDQSWKQPSRLSQSVKASIDLRSATTALQSDLVYKRYFARGSYEYQRGHSAVIAAASVGRITGQAPLFERFSLGDSTTLRGWNKFDVAPAGGDRMFHQSLEYRNHGVALFVDAGSVWDRDTDRKVRVATGFGVHTDGVFVTLGFPVNTSHMGAIFMIGTRF